MLRPTVQLVNVCTLNCQNDEKICGTPLEPYWRRAVDHLYSCTTVTDSEAKQVIRFTWTMSEPALLSRNLFLIVPSFLSRQSESQA